MGYNLRVFVSKILPFPSVRQSAGHTCGAAVCQAVLAYHGIDECESDIAEAIGVNKSDGVFVGPIGKYLNARNLDAMSREHLTILDLTTYIDRGIPVILSIQAWSDPPKTDYSDVWKDGHYLIAIGYDEDCVIFEDPSIMGKRGRLSFDELDSRWHDFDAGGGKIDHFGIAVDGPASYREGGVKQVASAKRIAAWFR